MRRQQRGAWFWVVGFGIIFGAIDCVFYALTAQILPAIYPTSGSNWQSALVLILVIPFIFIIVAAMARQSSYLAYVRWSFFRSLAVGVIAMTLLVIYAIMTS